MKNLMKAAHQMAKEIKVEYPNIDYKFQLGLCLSYLAENKGEVEMVELQGTEKQVKWAEELRKVVTNWVNQGIEKAMPKFSEKNLVKLETIKADMENDSAAWWIENFKGLTTDNLRTMYDYLNNSICGRKIASAINEIRDI